MWPDEGQQWKRWDIVATARPFLGSFEPLLGEGGRQQVAND